MMLSQRWCSHKEDAQDTEINNHGVLKIFHYSGEMGLDNPTGSSFLVNDIIDSESMPV